MLDGVLGMGAEDKAGAEVSLAGGTGDGDDAESPPDV